MGWPGDSHQSERPVKRGRRCGLARAVWVTWIAVTACSGSAVTEPGGITSQPHGVNAPTSSTEPARDAAVASPRVAADAQVTLSPAPPDAAPAIGWNCTFIDYTNDPNRLDQEFCYRRWHDCMKQRLEAEYSGHNVTECKFYDRAFCLRFRDRISEAEGLACSTTLEGCRVHARVIAQIDHLYVLHDCIPRD
jgi:hypothetical protein